MTRGSGSLSSPRVSGTSALAAEDAFWMARALRVAEWGLFTTAANPRVGCVIVRDGRLLAEATHWRAGEPHAERNALAMLTARGESARGSTAYVTLEPCSHHGRTPPCADALVEAGVARVVIAMQDPNPLVAGRGVERLREAGIDVVVGVLEAAAHALNPGFISRMTRGRPWVRVKLAMSLDGRTALADGESKWITDAPARRDVQQWRARAQAIVTGAGTVAADDPRLDVRETLADLFAGRGHRMDDPRLVEAASMGFGALRWDAPPPQPLRVVLDRNARLDAAHCALLREDDPARPVWWWVESAAPGAGGDRAGRTDGEGAEPARRGAAVACRGAASVVAAPARSGRDEHVAPGGAAGRAPGSDRDGIGEGLRRLLNELAAGGVNEVHVEAGATLAGALYRAGLVDEWLCYQAPVVLGETARPLLGVSIERMAERGEVEVIERRVVGRTLRWIARPVPRHGALGAAPRSVA